ncbi:MAG: HDOD domain-containing protein [Epsilonproteobacteria bacterium]|nr:hypothetical protein [Campylobacterota bacterium]NPA56353.1 HDOD domain-containing protein [Campylobacterota bacterium]
MRGERLFAKQPILDREFSIVAYELLYRHPESLDARIESDYEATLALINGVIGMADGEQRKRYFINVDEHFLFDEIIDLIPKERFVLEILERVPLTSAVLERIGWLREQGYTIALDDLSQTDGHGLDVLRHFDILKVDLRSFPDLESLPISQLRGFGVELLAEKVEEREEALRCRELGFSLFQGYFFAKPAIQRERVIDPYRLSIIRVLQAVEKREDLERVVEAIKKEPEVAIRLLQYVNSAFFNMRSPVGSIQRAVTLLGLDKLRIWLYLQLYGSGGREEALVELVRSRSALMEKLAQEMGLDGERAYLVGLISLLDVVLEVPKEKVFDLIYTERDVREAVLEEKGPYGRLLKLVRSIEEGRLPSLPGIPLDRLNKLLLTTLP